MPAEYDARLLESLAIRRQRLREVFVWGAGRDQQAIGDNVKRIAIGLIIAAVIGAGCVAWNLISGLLADQKHESGSAPIAVHTIAARTNPALTKPALTNPDLINPDLINPDLTNPDLINPARTNAA